jgi:hypothetical protein
MRYVTGRPRQSTADDLLQSPMLEAQTVHEPEPIDTGLVDRNGNTIFRIMGPIGFLEMKERK